MIHIQDMFIPFLLTLFAGLATGLGGIIVLNVKKTDTSLLSVAVGFSAGVMIYVSFIEIFPQGLDAIVRFFGPSKDFYATIFFFLGIFFIAIIDGLIPEEENPHEVASKGELKEISKDLQGHEDHIQNKENDLHRVGLMSSLAIAIHNFPEGLATFMSALVDPSLGITIAIAVAIHNVPEGISVAIPIYFATGSRRKAMKTAFLSGLAEPLGALAGALVLMPFLNDGILGLVFSFVAGIMVYISLDELLPTAEKYGKHHLSIYGLVAGMMIMAISLHLL